MPLKRMKISAKTNALSIRLMSIIMMTLFHVGDAQPLMLMINYIFLEVRIQAKEVI
jgi:hypothetical protein